MYYILDEDGYIEAVSSHFIECFNKTCTEYKGTIPEGYETLDDWILNANIRAYKLDDDENLIFDEARAAFLELELELEEKRRRENEIIVTATNTPPDFMPADASEWELIDKEFTPAEGSNGYTINKTNCTEMGSFHWIRSGHEIMISFSFTNKVQIADTALEMFTLDFEALGFSRLRNTPQLFFHSDLAKCAGFFNINYTSGAVNTLDVVPDNYISAGRTDNRATFTLVISNNYMLDDACCKFYWRRKRTEEEGA